MNEAAGHLCPHCGIGIDALTRFVLDCCPACGGSIGETSSIKVQVESVWGDSVQAGLGYQETIRSGTYHRRATDADPHLQQQVIGEFDCQPSPGEVYRLQDRIGEGGQGVVLAGNQRSLDRPVAIKRIRACHLGDARVRAAFLAEALILGKLEHPNIPPVHDLGLDQHGQPFLVMKRIDGDSWSETIATAGLQPNLDILLSTCDAVAYAHSKGIIHRDLKPANVMIGGFGEVQVMDWGLALPLAERERRIAEGHHSAAGTPAYMAPEMALGETSRIDQRSDIYLLGAILYEILSGRPPHTGNNAMDCLANAAENRIQPTKVHTSLLLIALTAMASDPSRRYADVAAFRAALKNHRIHAASDRLHEEGEAALAQAGFSVTYEHYLKAQAKFQQAIELWPQNEAARDGLKRCNLAYADTAFGRGDLDLAWQLLDQALPEHQPLAGRINAAFQRRQSVKRRLRALLLAVVLLTCATLLALLIGL
jgi:hypothetical protein